MVKFKNLKNFFVSTTSKITITKAPRTMSPAGTSGTEIYAGHFDEEYLRKIQQEKGIKAYDEMRRSDAHVSMLLTVIKNPIKSASWSIEPASEDEKDIEICEFIKFILFKDIKSKDGRKRKKFKQFVSEALTMIEFGHVCFEKVHKLVKNHPIYGDYIGLADLGFRHQRSLITWMLEEDGTLKAIEQRVNGDLGVNVLLAGQHLMVLTPEKEGDNYEGISMLRSCYGNYFRKNIYRKLQAIGIERAAKGVPIGTIPIEAKSTFGDDYDNQVSKFQDLLDNLSAHEKNGIVLGAGFDLKELKISHDSDKVQKVIDSENIEMSKRFLVSFMELGMNGGGGSYSLGSDLSDLFLNGIQYIADIICDAINEDIIEDLVDAKFGKQEYYPKLKATGINDKAGKELADIVATLIDKDAIQASVALQKYMHNLYKLPDLDEDIAEADKERFLTKNSQSQNQEDKKKLSDKLDCSKVHKCNVYRLSDKEREEFPISAMIEDYASDLNALMRKSLTLRSREFIDNIERVVKKGGSSVRTRVLNMKMSKSKAYETAFKEQVGDIIDGVYKITVKEVLDKSPSVVKFSDTLNKTPKQLREKLVAQILMTIEAQDIDIEKAVLFSFNENYETLEQAKLIKELERQVGNYFEKSVIQVGAVNMASTVVNKTRKAVFTEPELIEEIDSFVFMNPDPKSKICKHLTGRVFSLEEYETTEYDPPLHHNCKSYVRAQTKGDKGNKPITGLSIKGNKAEREEILRTKTL